MNARTDANTRATGSVAGDIARDLRSWMPPDAGQEALRDDYLNFLASRGEDSVDRENTRSHLTASCFVFTPDLSGVLLCFHRKGQFWVQLGGHIENTDRSVAAAAFREAVEEGGVPVAPVSRLPLDLDRHELGDGFARCDVHWDVGFAGLASRDSVPVASDESDDVRWWPVDALPSGIPEGFAGRVGGIVEAVRGLADGGRGPHIGRGRPRGL